MGNNGTRSAAKPPGSAGSWRCETLVVQRPVVRFACVARFRGFAFRDPSSCGAHFARPGRAAIECPLRFADGIGDGRLGAICGNGPPCQSVAAATSTFPKQALAIAARVRAALNQPATASRPALSSCARGIGVARATPGMTPDTLVANADTAMYESKRRGEGQPVLHDDVADVATTASDADRQFRAA
jgi:hypothetical protein